MSEAISALPGATFEGLVRVEDAGLRGMVTLRGDLGAAKLRKAVKDIVGVPVPDTCRADVAGGKGVLWMSPDELMILVPYADAETAAAALGKALKGTHYLAVNVSDARAVFRISGEGWREVLAKLTPADLHPDAFGPGAVRRTRLAQVAAAFWMTDEASVDLVCFRSVARYVFDLLSSAGRTGIGHF